VLWGSEAFGDHLRAAYSDGRLPKERLSDMVRRILRSMFAVGIDRLDTAPAPDLAAHKRLALQIARQGIVLLKNRGCCPWRPNRPCVLRSSRLCATRRADWLRFECGRPRGGYAAVIPIGGAALTASLRNLYLLPSSPLDALRRQFPHAEIEFDPGMSPGEAVLAARRADVAIVFGIRVEGEGFDSADLSLPWARTR